MVGQVVELWDEDRVRTLLEGQGSLTHMLLAVDKSSTEWLHQEHDLKAIVPPLTRMLNRYDVTRAAAAAGDEIGLGMGVLGYLMRSIRERADAIAAQRAVEPEPITGQPAVYGPDDDPTYQPPPAATASTYIPPSRR